MATLDPEIGPHDELEPVPLEAIAALEEVRKKRALIGIPGHVLLRIDDAPNKPPAWSIILGETTVRKSGKSHQ